MYSQLNSEQRYAISIALERKVSKKEIADAIGVHVSTIYREIERNSGKRKYTHKAAQENAQIRKERSKGNNKIPGFVKRKAVRLLEEEQWSPQQISGYLARKGYKISHQTIYTMIREDKENGGTLYKNCRHRGKYRSRPVGMRIPIPNRTSIHERPAEADGNRLGDIEMDLIVGKGNKGAILTLTDRKTNFLWMHKLKDGKNADSVAEAAVSLLLPYKRFLRTITTDNGGEFARHEIIQRKLGVKVYFADPYSSWQKGSIENSNKLIRQYIPKDADFDDYSEQEVKEVQYKLNRRPRKKLNFLSPKLVFFQLIS